jgi:2-polyprenyl-3-methyl-5-hydroxy-6-metoxy-1,4-benzoquinol methylase
MVPEYAKYTTYSDIEDLKRLSFIVETIRVNVPEKGKILDLGCGNGNISLAIGSCGYNVLGLDLDETSIDNANERNNFENVIFDVKNAEELNVNDKFDAIVCSEVLEHLYKPEELVKVIWNLLKENGIFIATVPNGYGPREMIVTKPVQFLMRHGFGKIIVGFKRLLGFKNVTLQSASGDLTHIQFYSKGRFTGMIKDAGFKSLKFAHANFVEKAFPFSLFAKRIKFLQRMDCAIADYLPSFMISGFNSSWIKSEHTK